MASLSTFLALFSVLAFQMRASAASDKASAQPRPVVLRKVIRRKVVSSVGAGAGGITSSQPVVSGSAPAASAPAPVVSSSS